jgi:hypothetical protein
MNRFIISESEKRSIILNYMDDMKNIGDNIVIPNWLSPDEKYMIFLDELYDIENKKSLGDIWKTPSNLILFLEHTYKTSNLISEIKENALKTFNKMLLTEQKIDLTPIKPLIKKFLKEGYWDDFKTYVSDTAKSSWEGIKDFGSKSWEGIKSLGIAISKGEWSEILNLLKKGAKFLARKLREALYSPVGIIVDAILIATGIGKGLQVVAWSIVVALDIYEFTSGDFENPEEPMIYKVLWFMMDLIGLVFAGVAAKTGKGLIKMLTKGVKTEAELSKVVAKNPQFKSLIQKGVSATDKAGPKMIEASKNIKGNNVFSNFIKSSLSSMGSFLTKIKTSLMNILKPKTTLGKGVRAGVTSTALVGGLGVYSANKNKNKNELNLSSSDFDKMSGEADYEDVFI